MEKHLTFHHARDILHMIKIVDSEDSVKMESASCPDGLCVHQGAISDGLLPIVCLPNKVQIQIVEDNNEESSETEEFDAKVG